MRKTYISIGQRVEKTLRNPDGWKRADFIDENEVCVLVLGGNGTDDDKKANGYAKHAEIHAPFVHGGIPDNIGCPHIAIHIVGIIRAAGPVNSIEGREIHFHTTFLYLGDGWSYKGGFVGGIVTGSGLPGGVGLRPVHKVGGVGASFVRAKDVITVVRRVEDH